MEITMYLLYLYMFIYSSRNRFNTFLINNFYTQYIRTIEKDLKELKFCRLYFFLYRYNMTITYHTSPSIV